VKKDYLQLADAVRYCESCGIVKSGTAGAAIGRKDFLQQKTPFRRRWRCANWARGTHASVAAGRMVEDRARGSNTARWRTPPGRCWPRLVERRARISADREIRGGYLRDVGAPVSSRTKAHSSRALRKPGNLPPEAIEWIAMRLGISDVRAIDSVVGLLSAQWPLTESSRSLIRIGGDPVAAAAGRLLEAAERWWRVSSADYFARVKPRACQIRAALADQALRTTALSLLLA